jgi:P27 family predicted phage terminase small subunit
MGIRGRKPTPIALRLLRGNPGRRRLPKQQAKPAAGATCPRSLSAEARAEWRRLQPELLRLGLLSRIDRAAFAAYCEAWADFRWAVVTIKAEGRVIESGNHTRMPHVAMTIKRGAMKAIREFASEFGFTPASRMRVEMAPPDGEDPDAARFFGPQPSAPPRGGKRT